MPVRVFNPLAKTHQNKLLNSVYRQQKQEKIRKYQDRITQIEHGSFSPLVFSTLGGFSPITTTTF